MPTTDTAATTTWEALRAARRAPATKDHIRTAPTSPGVYVWFRDNEPVYVGIGVNLRRRLTDHRSTSTRPRKSTLRASVGVLATGLPRTVLRVDKRYVPAEAALIDAWLDGCELTWVATPSRHHAKQIEADLLREAMPMLNLI